MAPIGSLLFGLLSCLLLSVNAAPTEIESRDLVGSIINALGVGLVTKINTRECPDRYVQHEPLHANSVKNPLIFELTITRVVSKAGVDGTVYASFDHTFDTPLVVPALKSVNSGNVPNVLLDQGVDNSLAIIPLLKLDLISVDVYVRAATINGKLGIPLKITGLKQSNVTTTYTFVS